MNFPPWISIGFPPFMPQVGIFNRIPNFFSVLYIHSFSSSENSTFFSYGITYYLVLNSKNNKKEGKWLKLEHQKLPFISAIFGKNDNFCLIFNHFVLNENLSDCSGWKNVVGWKLNIWDFLNYLPLIGRNGNGLSN